MEEEQDILSSRWSRGGLELTTSERLASLSEAAAGCVPVRAPVGSGFLERHSTELIGQPYDAWQLKLQGNDTVRWRLENPVNLCP